MNIAQIRQYDIANGPGIRLTIFVSGCTHHCKGCFNTLYKDFSYGDVYNREMEERILTLANDENVRGITFLGGDPLDQDDEIIHLLEKLQSLNKPIWIYSGSTYESILKDPHKYKIISYCDVLVDGPFVEELKDPKLHFKGSSNQRIIDIQESFRSGDIVLYKF